MKMKNWRQIHKFFYFHLPADLYVIAFWRLLFSSWARVLSFSVSRRELSWSEAETRVLETSIRANTNILIKISQQHWLDWITCLAGVEDQTEFWQSLWLVSMLEQEHYAVVCISVRSPLLCSGDHRSLLRHVPTVTTLPHSHTSTTLQFSWHILTIIPQSHKYNTTIAGSSTMHRLPLQMQCRKEGWILCWWNHFSDIVTAWIILTHYIIWSW